MPIYAKVFILKYEEVPEKYWERSKQVQKKYYKCTKKVLNNYGESKEESNGKVLGL